MKNLLDINSFKSICMKYIYGMKIFNFDFHFETKSFIFILNNCKILINYECHQKIY